MEGFNIRNARLYESWLRQQRAYFYRLAISGWETLAWRYVEERNFPKAEEAVTRLHALEPYNELGHQVMLRALHGQNRANELHAQYTRCVQILRDELDVAVSAETTALYNHLKSTPPEPSKEPAPPPKPAPSPYKLIRRDIELNELHTRLEDAQHDNRQVVLVRGDRGSGKTALLDTFATQAQEQGVRVLAATGSTIATTGDTYRIFRNLLRPLAGRWPQSESGVTDHVVRKIQSVSRKQPLLLIFDDLHWADSASWTLFYELVQQLQAENVMLVAAYRITWQRDTRWGNVLGELGQQPCCTIIDLDKARRREGESFVYALLDTRPNQLPRHFKKRLFTLTRGHPLLTVTFLRDLEQRGIIGDDTANTVQLLQKARWDDLPASMIDLLESWLQPLPPELREILRIASVEGDEFTAPVVKSALPDCPIHLLAQQLGTLDRRYGIIDALEPLKLGNKSFARYHFRYPIMRQYIYERTLTPLERTTLPEVLGLALNELFSV